VSKVLKHVALKMFWPYNRTMAMGTRKMRERQEELWYGGERSSLAANLSSLRPGYCSRACLSSSSLTSLLGRPERPNGGQNVIDRLLFAASAGRSLCSPEQTFQIRIGPNLRQCALDEVAGVEWVRLKQ
jgi:hypothetical protein